MHTKVCEVCGSEYTARRETQKTCSHACRAEARKHRVSLVCAHCGKSFEVIRAIADRSRFCSRTCYWKSGGPAQNSPLAKGGSVFEDRPRKSRPRVYLGRDDQGKPKYMQRSHWIWNQNHPDDPVQPGEHVHHIDHNGFNDDPTNLEKLSATDHAELHAGQIVNYERSRRMSAYHKANPGKYRKGTPKTCPICGNEFYRPPSASQITCSYQCSGKWSAQVRAKQRE